MNKWDFCLDCPLIDAPIVLPCGEPGGLAIVGEAPGQQEVNKNEPFGGLAGKLLRNVLEDIGMGSSAIWFTNTCLCKPARNESPTDAAIECCSQRLNDELAQCNKILAMGTTAIAATYGPASIQSVRGQRLWNDQLKRYVVPTYHPAAILRNPDYFPDFYLDLKQLTSCPLEYVQPEPPPPYTLVRTVGDILDMEAAIYARYDAGDTFHLACDIETTGLDEMSDDVLSVGISDSIKTWIIDADLLYASGKARGILNNMMTDVRLIWASHNGPQFDRKFLKTRFEIDWRIDFDTMLAHYCIDERRGSHSLKLLSRVFFSAPDYDAAIRDVKGNLDQLPKHELFTYNAYDVYYTHKLVDVLVKELQREHVTQIHDDLLLPASMALSDIEYQGVMLDQEHLKRLGEVLEREIEALVIEMQLETENPRFNPNSAQQVSNYLYNKLKLRAGGTTDKDVLKELKHPFADKVLEMRQKQKLLSTYVRGLLSRVGEDGRIHADFLLHGTVTGRLSSRDPNLQNIPARAGVIIRDAFIASPGFTLIEADYNQLELRIAAYYSEDEKLVTAFANEEDIHTQVACHIFNCTPEEVTQDRRYAAKFVDFGILYGRGAKSLAEGELNCSYTKAQRYLDNFLAKYSGLAKWMNEQHRLVLANGEVVSAFGRRRRFPIILENNKHEVLRQSVNAPIQSAASDLCLGALIRLHARFDPEIARILLTVHDSILFEVKEGYEEEILAIIEEEMVEHSPLKADFRFSIACKIGHSWGSLKKIKKEVV